MIICTFDTGRWKQLLRAVKSAHDQSIQPTQIVVAVDHNEDLLDRVREEIDGVTAVSASGGRGASATRNAGAAASGGEVIAFLDDDAFADPDWLAILLRHLDDPTIVGAGGRTVPTWPNVRPPWFPYEFDWVVGGAYRGLADHVTPVRNVWGSNMVIRRDVFERIGGFRENFGKVAKRPGPEDTELCIRAIGATRRGRWLYDPAAVVHHSVSEERVGGRFYMRRCYDEGRGKAELVAVAGTRQARESEVEFVRYVLGTALWREGRNALNFEGAALARVAAMALGLSSAMVGYWVGRSRLALRRVV